MTITLSITGPDGTVWSVGDTVRVAAIYEFPEKVGKIARIFVGNGSFAARPIFGDVNSVWFTLEDDTYVRPWLCTKVGGN